MSFHPNYWQEGTDELQGRYVKSRDLDITYWEMDEVIARRIVELSETHSWRALAIAATGIEDQMLGSDLEKRARWTLRLEDE